MGQTTWKNQTLELIESMIPVRSQTETGRVQGQYSVAFIRTQNTLVWLHGRPITGNVQKDPCTKDTNMNTLITVYVGTRKAHHPKVPINWKFFI